MKERREKQKRDRGVKMLPLLVFIEIIGMFVVPTISFEKKKNYFMQVGYKSLLNRHFTY